MYKFQNFRISKTHLNAPRPGGWGGRTNVEVYSVTLTSVGIHDNWIIGEKIGLLHIGDLFFTNKTNLM